MMKRRLLGTILGLAVLVALAAASCTTPPTFTETPNSYVAFNPVNIDSLPGTRQATAIIDGGYDEFGLAYINAEPALVNALPRLWAYQVWALSKSGNTITRKANAVKFLWDPLRHVAIQPNGNRIEPRIFNFQEDLTSFDQIVVTIEPYPDYYRVTPTFSDSIIDIVIIDSELTVDTIVVFVDSLTNPIDPETTFTERVIGANPLPDLEFLVADMQSGVTSYDAEFPVADDFRSMDSASYFLGNVTSSPATPASIANSANFGLWFGFRDIQQPIVPSLTVLPMLPEGWIYEGWIVPTNPNPALPISTGRFRNPGARDSSDQYSGPLSASNTLNMPGEDFLQNPPNLQWTFPMNLVSPAGDTGWVFVSVQPNDSEFAGLDPFDPNPDISDGPFYFRVLQAPLPDSTDTLKLPVFNPAFPDSNTFWLDNMYRQFPKFGYPGRPLFELTLGS